MNQTKQFQVRSKKRLKNFLWPTRYVTFDAAHVARHGNGFHYKGKPYVTHTTLGKKDSAVERTSSTQRIVLISLLATTVALGYINASFLLVAIVSLITILYFADLLFNFFLITRSMGHKNEITISNKAVAGRNVWPRYTILCPLYKETVILPQFIDAMKAIDYPKAKLEVLLLLEADDTATIQAAKALDLPDFFTIVVVPDSLPKTKPKACNYGLLRATGEYTVIYDAEDIPDPFQLKKAVLAFAVSDTNLGCIQAKLNYYNWNQNLLTRLFTLEYSLWFNLVLTGLQSIDAPIPLGGTSNHFRTQIIRDLGGWDPFNVTEDADLGIRLSKRGLRTAVLDSITLEEANSQLGNWLKQRARWIKGYMQTYLVHTRRLGEFSAHNRRIDVMTFQLVIGGKVLSALINPVLWILTISYFAFRPIVGDFVESLYLAPIFYLGAISLVIGNFLYLYYYMIGAAREGRPELVVYALFVPLYWIMMSIAAYYALRDLIIRPFHWHKTKHGLHIAQEKTVEVVQ